MGKSNSIAEKERQDREFRAFMEERGRVTAEKEKQIGDSLKARVEEHYGGNGWKGSRLAGTSNTDYQNYDTWNLDRVAEIGRKIALALKGGDFPSKDVPGSEAASKGTVEEAKQYLDPFQKMLDLSVARVIALLNGVLSELGSSSDLQQKTQLRDLPLGGGQHLFFGCSAAVFSSQSFFRNQFIGEFVIVYSLHMSVDEAKATALAEILRSTQSEISQLNVQIEKIYATQDKVLTKLLDDGEYEKYASTQLTFETMLKKWRADREQLVKEFDKYKSVSDTVERLAMRTASAEELESAIARAVPTDLRDLAHGLAGELVPA